MLKVNLGRAGGDITSFSVLFPFIRTGMTDEYAENDKVYGRWQPRMLETHECAEAFTQLLSRPADELDLGMFELQVDGTESDDGAATDGGRVGVDLTWNQVRLDVREDPLAWSSGSPLQY